jgi:hypothetical protein
MKAKILPSFVSNATNADRISGFSVKSLALGVAIPRVYSNNCSAIGRDNYVSRNTW